MPVARYTSLQLARFVDLTPHGGLADAGAVPAHALQCGCDARAAGTDPARLEGWVFLLLGYHEREEDAARALATRARLVPWWDRAEETWGAVLAPARNVLAKPIWTRPMTTSFISWMRMSIRMVPNSTNAIQGLTASKAIHHLPRKETIM